MFFLFDNEIFEIQEKELIVNKLSDDLVDITDNFNKETPKKNAFLDVGYMINSTFYTAKCKANYVGDSLVLGDLLEDEKDVLEEFYIDNEEFQKWEYQKGAKSIERVNKTTGHKYLYKEGSMGFPDCLKNLLEQ